MHASSLQQQNFDIYHSKVIFLMCASILKQQNFDIYHSKMMVIIWCDTSHFVLPLFIEKSFLISYHAQKKRKEKDFYLPFQTRGAHQQWVFPYRMVTLRWPWAIFCRDFGVSWGYKWLATSKNGWASPSIFKRLPAASSLRNC